MSPDNVVFVMDASIGQACEAQARAFKEKVVMKTSRQTLIRHTKMILFSNVLCIDHILLKPG